MIRGWCPSLYEPMATGDGLLVRVKPPAARLTSTAARALADAAERHGNGTIELTRRGNLQLRGLTPEGLAPFAAAMVAAGLADPDPATERRRVVIPPTLAGDDPAVPDIGLAEHIERSLPGNLPAKFGIAIESAGILPRTPDATLVVRADGSLSPRERVRATTPPPPVGWHPYGTGQGAFGLGLPFGATDAAGLRLVAAWADRFSGGAIRVSPWRTLLLGRVSASDVAELASESERPLPLPPGEGVAAQGSARDSAWNGSGGWGEGRHACRPAPVLPLTQTLSQGERESMRFIVDPGDPRLLVTACVGAPACASASVPARQDAARFSGGRMHFSGCAKGCAYPGGPVMVGEAGRYVRAERWTPGAMP